MHANLYALGAIALLLAPASRATAEPPRIVGYYAEWKKHYPVEKIPADTLNPLLADPVGTPLPPFDLIRPEHAEPALDHVLALNRDALQVLLKNGQAPNWESLVEPLEQAPKGRRLDGNIRVDERDDRGARQLDEAQHVIHARERIESRGATPAPAVFDLAGP